MRSRPDVEVRIPSFVYPGQSVLVDVRVRSGSVTPIDFIEVELKGLQLLRVTGSSAHQSSEFLVQVARVAGEGRLAVGEHTYQAMFRLPPNAFPSYVGQLFQYRYFLKLHVSIPWWPDVALRYDLVVLLPPATRQRPAPFAGTNVAAGGAPFVEVSLSDQYFAPGEIIEGALAFGNLGGRRPSQAALSLLGYERFLPYAPNEAYRFTAFKSLVDVPEGEEVPFRFAVPKVAIPSFEIGEVASLFWALHVQLELQRGAPVSHSIPITLARFDRPAEAGTRRRVGNGRWHAVWEQVGRSAGLTLDPTELELHGAWGGCSVSVKIGADGDGKQGLIGELRWEPWGIGLSIRDRGLLDFGLDLEDKAFAQRFRVRGRCEGQTREALTHRLLTALSLFDEVYADDQRAVLRSRTPGHDQPWIGQFVRQLQSLAEALDQASPEIPPPPALLERLPAYQRFAEELGARLERGSLSLRGGRLDGARFEVETDFGRGDEPRGTLITLELDPPLARPFDAASPEALASAPPLTRRLLGELGGQIRALHEANGSPLDEDEAPRPRIGERAIAVSIGVALADPAAAREAMGAMIALGETLRGEKRIGPYR